jgi:hypothetical protein
MNFFFIYNFVLEYLLQVSFLFNIIHYEEKKTRISN